MSYVLYLKRMNINVTAILELSEDPLQYDFEDNDECPMEVRMKSYIRVNII